MAISRLAERSIEEFRAGAGPPSHTRAIGHSHFWERAMSRGALIKGVAGVGGAAATGALWMPALARAGGGTTSAAPVPVPANPAAGGVPTYPPPEKAGPPAAPHPPRLLGSRR